MKIGAEDRLVQQVQSLTFSVCKSLSGNSVRVEKGRGLNMRHVALACLLILMPCSLLAQDKKQDWWSRRNRIHPTDLVLLRVVVSK
jgi:hypothetical protein